ncbi:beta-ketoacyl synthase chain length factor [Rhodanobacter sp. 7MK24]|uniref:beta-ketoacyl synthase chain length factor n=1 Tax=Rhodanobacter sp. 7MK24 TaxID=2775922 RepID=UPI00177F31BE|nr:beta-ketoacyl synthase chain length factor [Rhodanobacter sp. 7MK24]MBD8880043.1 beta-ketoacyl synthase chain length factor [Rhodanobacter sp. 7MK24]
MTSMELHVEGIGLWSPRLGDFAALRALLAGEAPAASDAPIAALLPANERRRAPGSVRLAVEVAGQALGMGGYDPTALACVFASAHGDQSITDEICATLARAPTELSPTRFHHSVHNASAGYWTIATGCRAPSSAMCAGAHTFGAALLEAATQALAEQRPVLLVCSDTAGSGPLLEMTGCGSAFGCALLLTPEAGANALARLRLRMADDCPAPTPAPAALRDEAAGNPCAAALPLLALLATRGGVCRVGCATAMDLLVDVEVAD